METTRKTTKTETPIHKVLNWCWLRGVTIYPIPQVSNGKLLKICVNNKGIETLGTEVYPDGQAIYDKILELYRNIYNKNQNKK